MAARFVNPVLCFTPNLCRKGFNGPGFCLITPQNTHEMMVAPQIYLVIAHTLLFAGAEELLQLNPNQTTILTQAPPIPAPLTLLNQSIAPVNISLSTNFNIQCSWQRYGFLSTSLDCQSAWRFFYPSTIERAWVLRRRGAPEDAYALPLMIMGRKLGGNITI